MGSSRDRHVPPPNSQTSTSSTRSHLNYLCRVVGQTSSKVQLPVSALILQEPFFSLAEWLLVFQLSDSDGGIACPQMLNASALRTKFIRHCSETKHRIHETPDHIRVRASCRRTYPESAGRREDHRHILSVGQNLYSNYNHVL